MQRREPEAYHLDIGFEKGHVHGVEADDGHVEPDVEFGYLGAEPEWSW
jgi:hypothetical protein